MPLITVSSKQTSGLRIGGMPLIRVSSKQTKNIFGLNRKEPKHNLFRLFFGLFRETKNFFFSVCFGVSNTYRNNRNNKSVSKKTETNKKNFVNCTPLGIAYTGL